MNKTRNTLSEPSEQEREYYAKLVLEYPFEYRLSHFFASEMSKALYREEILEVSDFLEKLLHKTQNEEETE